MHSFDTCGAGCPNGVMARCSRYSSSSTSRAPAPALVFALAFVFFVFAATVLTRLLSSRTCPRTRPCASGARRVRTVRELVRRMCEDTQLAPNAADEINDVPQLSLESRANAVGH